MNPSPIVLSTEQIAEATGGYWENLPKDGLTFSSVAFRTSQMAPGCLAVTYNNDQWDRRGDTEAQLPLLFEKGAVAAVVRKGNFCEADVPVLRVSNTKKALRDIALSSSLYANSRKILVTGSVGKTGFKTQLHHLIAHDHKTHAAINSGNMDLPIWANLASIRKDDVFAVIEVAVPGPSLGAARSLMVRPDLCVITEIAAEHIKQQGGSVSHIVANKAEVARGLRPGGTLIVPGRDDLYGSLSEALRHHAPDARILKFGEHEGCDGQLLEQRFRDYGWDVRARIGTEEVAYRLPLLEEYAPQSSVAVLLTAQQLGIDIHTAVLRYRDYKQFKTSGKFYRLRYRGRRIFFYDQSLRGELDGFKSTLRLASHLTPEAGGKKIAVFSEFTNLEEGPLTLVDKEEFSPLIAASGITDLYTAHFFTEHINVLPDRSIWREHSFKIDGIIARIIDSLSDNDILFVRGTLKSGLNKLTEQIIQNSEEVEVVV